MQEIESDSGQVQEAEESGGLGPAAIGRGVVTLVLIVLTTIFALQNSASTEVSFLVWDFSLSLILVMFLSAAAGIAIWGLVRRLLR